MSKAFIRQCEKLTPLRESGPFYVGCCPYCGERNWLWVVNTVKERAYCFGCRQQWTKRQIIDEAERRGNGSD